MRISYRTRQRLKRLGMTILILVMLLAIVWVGGIVYLKRYVVLVRDQGIVLDFNVDTSNSTLNAVVASPPVEDETVPIFYNEGENALAANKELTPLWGYYITTDDLAKDLAGCRERVALLEADTAVMIELKRGFGTFNYSTQIPGAPLSENVDVEAVNAFIQELKSRNLYTIARISAFRDRSYGMEHVNRGIYHVSKMGLWPDSQHCYWLDPTNSTVLSYVTSVVQEVKAKGFDEIVLADFKIPSSDKALFNGDKNQALTSAAAALAENCGTEQVILSFVVDSSSFQLPEGQCRLYLDTVAAERVGAAAALTTVETPKVIMVFIADSNDTRYDEYSVLRPIAASDVLGSGNRE